MHLVLVGMMGSGKTTVGQRVAAQLHRPFYDSDRMVEAREGRTVREIWRAEGEAAYRALETAALRDALASPVPAVIAAAGGVVLREENRALLRDPGVCTVRLHAAPEVLAGRVGAQEHRPLLDEDPLVSLQRLAAEREPFYREVAGATVEVGGASVDDVCRAVLLALEACAG